MRVWYFRGKLHVTTVHSNRFIIAAQVRIGASQSVVKIFCARIYYQALFGNFQSFVISLFSDEQARESKISFNFERVMREDMSKRIDRRGVVPISDSVPGGDVKFVFFRQTM